MRDAPDQRIVSKNSDDTSAFPLELNRGKDKAISESLHKIHQNYKTSRNIIQ